MKNIFQTEKNTKIDGGNLLAAEAAATNIRYNPANMKVL